MVFITPISLHILEIKTFVNKDALFILSFYKYLLSIYCILGTYSLERDYEQIYQKMRKCEDLSAIKKVNGECEKEVVEVAT